MTNSSEITYRNEVLCEKVVDLSRKLLTILYEEESVNIRLSCVLSMLLTVAHKVPPEDQFFIGSVMEDCMKILGIDNKINAIH